MSTLSTRERQLLVDLSEPLYLGRGYHTVEHRDAVIEDRLSLGSLALAHGVQSDEDTGIVAAAWHDAAIGVKPKDIFVEEAGVLVPASSNEQVASVMFDKEAGRLSIPTGFRREVMAAILGTNPQGELATIEAKLLAAADIRGVGLGSYEQFLANTYKLRDEAQWRSAQKIDWPDFVAGSINYLGLFVGRNIHVTPRYFDESKRSAWHVGAVENILKLGQDTWADLTVSGELTDGIEMRGKDWLTSRNLQINLSTDGVLKEAEEGYVGKPAEMKLSVPVEGRAFSVPDEIFDRLEIEKSTLRSPRVVREAGRVLKVTGMLLVKDEINSPDRG